MRQEYSHNVSAQLTLDRSNVVIITANSGYSMSPDARRTHQYAEQTTETLQKDKAIGKLKRRRIGLSSLAAFENALGIVNTLYALVWLGVIFAPATGGTSLSMTAVGLATLSSFGAVAGFFGGAILADKASLTREKINAARGLGLPEGRRSARFAVGKK